MEFTAEDLRIIQDRFHELILERNKINSNFTAEYQKTMSSISNDNQAKNEWFAVPGMYGGFSYRLSEKDGKPLLTTESWCRVVGGSGQRHEINTDGCILVEEGFV